MVDAHAHGTYSIVDGSIIVSLLTGCLLTKACIHVVNMTFRGPARDTVLTNRQTEKLNFDSNYITIEVVTQKLFPVYLR
jgi:hypothetical protein